MKEVQFEKTLKSKDEFIGDLAKRNRILVADAESDQVSIRQLRGQVILLESGDAYPPSAIKIASLESELEILRMENTKIASLEAELSTLNAGRTSTSQ